MLEEGDVVTERCTPTPSAKSLGKRRALDDGAPSWTSLMDLRPGELRFDSKRRRQPHLSTGDLELDAMLRGGLRFGTLTEFVGER